MNRNDYRQLLLAGTVTFPATFPQLGRISLVSESVPCQVEGVYRTQDVLVVHEFPSAKVTITRRVFADKVRALFLPQDPNRVSYACGEWLLNKEIADRLRRCKGPVLGILFVPESESTLLEVRAGLTAGESAQYYPPLPSDRSYNHYSAHPKQQHMFSCDGCDHMESERYFSCDGNDEMRCELFSCDGDDGMGCEFFSCDENDVMLCEFFSCDGDDPSTNS